MEVRWKEGRSRALDPAHGQVRAPASQPVGHRPLHSLGPETVVSQGWLQGMGARVLLITDQAQYQGTKPKYQGILST